MSITPPSTRATGIDIIHAGSEFAATGSLAWAEILQAGNVAFSPTQEKPLNLGVGVNCECVCEYSNAEPSCFKVADPHLVM